MSMLYTEVTFCIHGKKDGYLTQQALSAVPRVGEKVTLWTNCKGNQKSGERYLCEDSTVVGVEWVFDFRFKDLPGDRGYGETIQGATVYLER